MRQHDYRFSTIDEAIGGIDAIRGLLESQEHADALAVLYTSGIGKDEARRLLDVFDDALPHVKRAGISEYPYGLAFGDLSDIGAVRVNVTLSDSARFHTVQIPCEAGGEQDAAVAFARAFGQIEGAKAVALYPANVALDVTAFLERASVEMLGTPFFGAMAGLLEDPLNHNALGGSFGIGDDLLESGFTAVIFAGEHLHVFMDYILGWRPVGREMELVLGKSNGPDGCCIQSIDGKPALEVYEKYLGVTWNDSFVPNVCEFPLMVERNKMKICMVPAAAGANGELQFLAPMRDGEKIRFSYGTHESVLQATRAGRDRMRAFGAQAVHMTLCGNRAYFLGRDAHLEWDLYREFNPQLSFCHGNFEIAWCRNDDSATGGHGGVLNSALVAIGFREGGADFTVEDPSLQADDVDGSELPARDDGTIPLSLRLGRFFDVMTGELVHLQHNLEQEVELKTRENKNLMLHVVITLAAAIDAKDEYTNGHSSRVAQYSREIARRAGYPEAGQEGIYMMGILHDVGKIGVPDSIINKPGKLTDEEFAVIKTHPAVGARILAAIEEMPGLAVGAHWHHERYDGRGYPDGLAGKDIPEPARIIAVADAYDAMTSNRSYRDAMSQEEVREQVEHGRGTQFDPRFADIMLEMIDDDPDYLMRER